MFKQVLVVGGTIAVTMIACSTATIAVQYADYASWLDRQVITESPTFTAPERYEVTDGTIEMTPVAVQPAEPSVGDVILPAPTDVAESSELVVVEADVPAPIVEDPADLGGLIDPASLAAALDTPCELEDSVNCYWIASSRGNHAGTSFVNVEGHIFPLTSVLEG